MDTFDISLMTSSIQINHHFDHRQFPQIKKNFLLGFSRANQTQIGNQKYYKKIAFRALIIINFSAAFDASFDLWFQKENLLNLQRAFHFKKLN